MENTDTISFVTEEGESVLFSVIEETKFAGKRYLLVSCGEDDEQEALILRDDSAETDKEAVYVVVEDEKEMSALAGIFSELVDDIELEF